MKSRLIWMIATGLILALLLLAAVQATSFLSNTPSVTEDIPVTSVSVDPADTGLSPVIFRTVSEYAGATGRQMRVDGTSEPEAVLIVLNRNQRLRQIKSDENGNWGLDINVDPAATMVLEIVMFIDGGLNVRGDETVYRIPVPIGNEGEDEDDVPEKLALIMVTAPGGPTRIVQTPFGGSPTDGPLTMGPIDYDDSGGVIFSGTTEEEGRVRIYAGPSAIGETRVGAGGRWNFIAGNMPLGEYEIAAELIKSEGIKARVSVPFERLAPSQNKEISVVPDIRYDPFRWQVRRQLIGGGTQYTAIFAPQEAKALIVAE